MSCRAVLALSFLVLVACREGVRPEEDVDGGLVEPADAGLPSSHPGQVWVMTWNVKQFPLSDSAIAKVRSTIEARQPDVLVLQEIDDVAAFATLDDMLDDYTGTLADDSFNSIRVAMLVRHNVVVDHTETLFKNDGASFPRPPLLMHVSAEGFDFTVVALHLKAGFTSADRASRRAAVMALETWVRGQLSLGEDADIVLAGDWNDELTVDGTGNIFGPFLDAPEAYRFLDLPLGQGGQGTFIPGNAQLDHVLVTADALDEYGAGTTEILRLDDADSSYEDTVSDHRPIMVKFHVP
jgi:endonuclease/exonuclease/phosphatase family metal-dependent hydrolase